MDSIVTLIETVVDTATFLVRGLLFIISGGLDIFTSGSSVASYDQPVEVL